MKKLRVELGACAALVYERDIRLEGKNQYFVNTRGRRGIGGGLREGEKVKRGGGAFGFAERRRWGKRGRGRKMV